MDDNRSTIFGLIAALLLATLAGLATQLFVDEQRVDSAAGVATYVSITGTVEAITRTAASLPNAEETALFNEANATREPSQYDLLYATAREEWSLIAYEPYDVNERGWSEGRDSNRSRGRRGIVEGVYKWEMTAIEDLTWATAPIIAPTDTFFVEVQMRKRGVTSGSQNLTFRYTDQDNYFDFGICPDGVSYQVWRQLLGEWTRLIECQENATLRPNETNALAVLAQTDRYHLYANGNYLATFEDDLLVGGNVGVSFDLSADQTNIFEFDNLELRAPTENVGR
ncbi:MAG: hypothetical protein ACPG8W_08770 [Candidatus Promineifilaceae bacterium]